MATDRDRVEKIVAAALPLDLAGRAAWLERACGEDAALRAWAEALIRAREQQITDRRVATPVAERPAHAGNGKSHQPVADALPRRKVPPDVNLSFLAPSSRSGSIGVLGRYEVREVLGHGGLSIVLRALDERLRRVVAIKVLQPAVAASGA